MMTLFELLNARLITLIKSDCLYSSLMQNTNTAASPAAIDREAIAETYSLIRPFVRRTPVVEADGSEFGIAAASLVFKLELLQHSGSFKARGAFTNLLRRQVPPAGVVAAS